MTTPFGQPTNGEFEHAALIIESDDSLDKRLMPVLHHHLISGEPALLVVGQHTERALRDRLGADADTLEWGESGTFYQRLGFAFESFRRYLGRQHERHRKVHVIAEPDIPCDLDAPVDRVAAYLSYEAAVNDAYAGYGCPVTCIWDSRRHPTLDMDGVRCVHSHELTERGMEENKTFVSSSDYLAVRANLAMPPEPPAVDLDVRLSKLEQLTLCRAVVVNWATSHGFASIATEQVTAATNEALTNGLQHGQPPVRLRTWHHGQTLVAQVDDHGHDAIPPDAGYQPPTPPDPGLGLWITRQFADVVLTRSMPYLTTVRMYFPYELTHRNPDG